MKLEKLVAENIEKSTNQTSLQDHMLSKFFNITEDYNKIQNEGNSMC